MKSFKLCEKSVNGALLIFYMKLQRRKRLKLTQMVFLGKILHSCNPLFLL